MAAIPMLSSFGFARWLRLADWLAVAVVASLPWSTSVSSILIALWLVVVLPTMDADTIWRELMTPAGGLPVLLWVVAALGMLWADVPWFDRFHGLSGFNRLLVVPLVLAQFRRSGHGLWILHGFLASVLVVLFLSWALILFPGLPWRQKMPGVPVKDYILQSTDFLICAFALLDRAFDEARSKRWPWAVALLTIVALFVANIGFVVTGRTALLIAPVLLLLFGWRQLGWKGVLGAGLLGCILGVTIWFGSSYLRERLDNSIRDLNAYLASDAMSPTAVHLEFLRKSLSFVEADPIVGHGTGSILEEFRSAAVGDAGASSATSDNPHNQIFAVAIQLGLLGTAVLLAMWASHLMLFRGSGLIAWTGTIVVVQNFVACLFNSHLFDFTQGWLYVFGVGVVGGMVLRERDAKLAARP